MINLFHHLAFLYGENQAPQLQAQVENIIADYRARIPASNNELTERDSILITYGDQVQSPDEKPLLTLSRFCKQYLTDVIGGIHILPFDPWISGRWLFSCKKTQIPLWGIGKIFPLFI